VSATRSTNVGAVTDFGFTIGGGLRYRVIVRRDLQRGGYSAKLSSDGIGMIMEPNGTSPSDALTRLARELWGGDSTDRKIAKEIVRHAWFPLRLS
jgi:hypothetical protein